MIGAGRDVEAQLRNSSALERARVTMSLPGGIGVFLVSHGWAYLWHHLKGYSAYEGNTILIDNTPTYVVARMTVLSSGPNLFRACYPQKLRHKLEVFVRRTPLSSVRYSYPVMP